MRPPFLDLGLRGLLAASSGESAVKDASTIYRTIYYPSPTSATLDYPSSTAATLDNPSPTSESLSPQQTAEIPGDSPFSFCDASGANDLLYINYVWLNVGAKTARPVYINDGFQLTVDGTFMAEFNLSYGLDILNVTVDCGSHCAEYGWNNEPGEPEDLIGFTFPLDLERFVWIDQKGLEDSDTVEARPATLNLLGYITPHVVVAPAWYNVTFDAVTEDGRRMFCLTTEVCLRWEDEAMNQRFNFGDGPWNDCVWPR